MGNQICCKETRTQILLEQTQKPTVIKNQGLVESSTKFNASQNVSLRELQPKTASIIERNPQTNTLIQPKEDNKIPELTYQISVVIKKIKFLKKNKQTRLNLRSGNMEGISTLVVWTNMD